MKCFLSASMFALIACTVFAQSIPNGGTITCAYYSEPSSFIPFGLAYGTSPIFLSLLANGLVKINERMEPVPDLAERWEASPDGLTWTFYLKKGVRFHDGSRLTADDVLFTFGKTMDPANGNPSAAILQPINSLKAESSTVIKVFLKAPYGLLPYVLRQNIYPQRLLKDGAAAEADFDKHPVGTGPFKLAERKPGQLIFDANLDYFEGRPHLDRIVFNLFPDQKKAWVSLMQGETDVVTDIDYEDYAVIRNDDRFTVSEHLDVFCHSLFFNLKDPLFSQSKIREAVSLAVDRTDLLEKALLGGGIPTTGPFQPGTWPYDPDPALQAFDPGKAVKILAGLGWKDTDGDWVLEQGGEELRFTALMDRGDKIKEAVAKRLQWQLLQIGIRMDVEILPLQDLMQKRLARGAFQAVILQFNTAGDPDLSASAFWSSLSIGRSNLWSYKNPQVDMLIEQGRAAADFGKRQEIYRKIHELISTDAPAAFLFYLKRYSAASSRLHISEELGSYRYESSVKDWYITGQNQKERR